MAQDSGRIEVVCGGMFSGKTDELIQRVERARYARKKIQVFKHSLDTRYSEHQIVSHNGLAHMATPVQRSEEIMRCVESGTTIVGIDEAQFFDADLPRAVDDLANRGIRVICAGLDTDFRGEPFGPMAVLMSYAEEVLKRQAVCMVCGENACRTQRLVNGEPAHYDSPVILIGAAEAYEARCRHHHIVPKG